MRYYQIAESTFVHAKSIRDGLRIVESAHHFGFTPDDFKQVNAHAVRHVNNWNQAQRGCFRLYFDGMDGFPCQEILEAPDAIRIF